MSNIFINNSMEQQPKIENNSNQRKRIFATLPASQNQLTVPLSTFPKISHNSLNIDQELSYIAPAEIEQKPQSRIENKSEIRNELVSQQDPTKQSLLKDVQLDNLENILTLIRSTVPMNQSNLQGSRISNEPQYYQQIEMDAEKQRDQFKMEGRTVHTIIEKHKKVKTQQQSINQQLKVIQEKLIYFDQCTQYSQFSQEIRYTFNQFESKADELRDLFNDAFNFMSVVSVAAYEKSSRGFDEDEVITEAEFTSMSMKLYTSIELVAKEYELILSEKRRLGNINQNHQSYKQACSQLLQQIKQYPQQEMEFTQSILQLQRSASIYFKGVSKELQQSVAKYQDIIQDYRLSLAQVDKIFVLKEQIQSFYNTFDNYQYIIHYLYRQPSNYNDNYCQFKQLKSEVKDIDLNYTKHFYRMKNKIYTKTCIFIDQVNYQIKQQRMTVEIIVPLLDNFQKYQKSNYRYFFDILFTSLKLTITKEQWQHLINLYNEILQEKSILKKTLLQLREIQQQHPTLQEFVGKFSTLINSETKFIDELFPQVEPYLHIHDIEAHIEYVSFKDNFLKQRELIEPKMQEILMNLPQQLQLSDIESQNLKKINIEKLFIVTHHLQATACKLQKRKVLAEIEQMKHQLQTDIQFEKDVICLLESMQYLHTGNLQMIVEDFHEIDQKNNNSSLQQLIEVVAESSRKIENIQSERLQEIKVVQVHGFQWVLKFFTQFDHFRKNLVNLICSSQAHIEFQRTIQINLYEDFVKDNQMSHLFFYLNQYPRKYQHWVAIKNELTKVVINAFKIYQKKVMDKIDVLGGEKPLNILQLDSENCEKILKWFSLEQHHSNIAKGVLLYQGYKKIKVSNSQFQSTFNSQENKQRYISEIQVKMFEILNKLKEQYHYLSCETKYALHCGTESQDEDELDKLLFTELQEEWTLDFIEKGQDLSFIIDVQNYAGVFDSPFMIKSLIFVNLNSILQLAEIDIKRIRTNLLNIIQNQT